MTEQIRPAEERQRWLSLWQGFGEAIPPATLHRLAFERWLREHGYYAEDLDPLPTHTLVGLAA